jgi:cell division protein FtsW
MNPPLRRQSLLTSILVRKHRPDYGLLIIACILLAVGLVVMYAISPALAGLGGGVSENYYVSRQFIAIILGLVLFFIFSRIKLETWAKLQLPMIVTSFILSILVVILGGLSNRWLQLGAFSFQPVELVKFVLVINGAFFLAKMAALGHTGRMAALKPLVAIFLLFGIVIVVLQRDLGSAFVLCGMAGIMAYVAELPLKRLLIFGSLVIMMVIIAIASTGYRRDRLLTFLQPERDCISTGYHACQALIAVGSGGLFGVGLGHSVQAYGYLPKAANDSIFAIYSEKFGFVGTIVLLALYGALLLRILNIMQRAPNKTTQLICGGVFSWLAIQATVNIGAMIGLLPLKGITLPFISAGGTSLIFVMMALGVVFQISSYTVIRKSLITTGNERGSSEDTHHWRGQRRSRYATDRYRRGA